jgi:hypothetical protein
VLPEATRSRPGFDDSKRTDTRRDLLRLALRDTLHRNGIPADWITADALVSTTRTGVHGLHWRLSIRHWDPRLLTHALALQEKLRFRVLALDPLGAKWLTGISWQFALPDDFECPSMPHPGSWTARPPEPVASERKPAAAPAVGVIAGPVRISERSASHPDVQIREDLAMLRAVRKADAEHTAAGKTRAKPQFARTEPMKLNTEPAHLNTEPGRLK